MMTREIKIFLQKVTFQEVYVDVVVVFVFVVAVVVVAIDDVVKLLVLAISVRYILESNNEEKFIKSG